ncbi:MAG: methyltransferase, partial [Alphaproteobacteria bacterium]|nr:methyltransferase [Alphaproteobacteria bacterium]
RGGAGAPRAKASRGRELGCGAGAGGWGVGARIETADAVGVEIDPDLADLARENLAANDFTIRARIVEGDAATFGEVGFDLVMVNPPYLDPARADPSPHARKRKADMEGELDLAGWVKAAKRAASPKAHILFVQRADRLADLLAAMKGLGELVVFPLWPKAGEPAKRVLVRARLGSKAPLTLARGLVLHGSDGKFSAAADSILRDGGELPLL